MNKVLSLDSAKFAKSMFGAVLISIGIIYAEKSIDVKDTGKNGIIGALVFLAGWAIFLSTQDFEVAKYGIIVLAIAMIGQIYMGWIITKDPETRKNYIAITMMVCMIFMAVWILYLYMLSNSKTQAILLYSGMITLMISMIGYFFYRNSDWNTLTGGLIPRIEKDGSIFNEFVVLFPVGWSLIAVGNSLM